MSWSLVRAESAHWLLNFMNSSNLKCLKKVKSSRYAGNFFWWVFVGLVCPVSNLSQLLLLFFNNESQWTSERKDLTLRFQDVLLNKVKIRRKDFIVTFSHSLVEKEPGLSTRSFYDHSSNLLYPKIQIIAKATNFKINSIERCDCDRCKMCWNEMC